MLTRSFGDRQPSAGAQLGQSTQNLRCPPSQPPPGVQASVPGWMLTCCLQGATHYGWQCQDLSVLLASAMDGARDPGCHCSLRSSSPAGCGGSSLLAHKGKKLTTPQGTWHLPAAGHRSTLLSSPRRSCATTWLSWASETGTTRYGEHPLPADQDPQQGPGSDPSVAEWL